MRSRRPSWPKLAMLDLEQHSSTFNIETYYVASKFSDYLQTSICCREDLGPPE